MKTKLFSRAAHSRWGKERVKKAIFDRVELVPRMIGLLLAIGSASAQITSTTLVKTLKNPVPSGFDEFGYKVTAVGDNRILIGSWGNTFGGAYLFDIDGNFIRKFSRPKPRFGTAVAAIGDDRVIIGAAGNLIAEGEGPGAAYLFNTDGALIRTFNSPAGTRYYFGFSVGAVGTDQLLIGEIATPVGGLEVVGQAYLYQTDGTLRTTFKNPDPTAFANFGWSVSALGSERVIITAPRAENNLGRAYVFSTTGTLITSLTNPAPDVADRFGTAATAVGADRVLIGASDYGGGKQGGAAYLFTVEGTLLTTFANPAPTGDDNFGWSVSAVGTDRVLIGAHGTATGNSDPGNAYLFSLDGTLLTTISKPNPKPMDRFGWGVAALGSGRLLITATGEDTGAPGAGAVYLFSLRETELSITREAATVDLRWESAENNLILQESDLLGSPPVWSNTTAPIILDGLHHLLKLPIGEHPETRFYRLRRP